MALNHTQLRALKPAEKPYKATDRDGLYLDVLPSGVMTWRFQYHLNARREKVTFGRYPEIGLADARRMREEAAALVAIGQSPAKTKQTDKAAARVEAAQASTFKELSERWFAVEVAFKSENWKYSVQNWLNLDLLPALGKMKPKDITADDVHALVKKVVGRGSPANANKVRMICVQMFRYAVRNKERKANPAMEVEAVATPAARSHRALGVKEIGPFPLGHWDKRKILGKYLNINVLFVPVNIHIYWDKAGTKLGRLYSLGSPVRRAPLAAVRRPAPSGTMREGFSLCRLRRRGWRFVQTSARLVMGASIA